MATKSLDGSQELIVLNVSALHEFRGLANKAKEIGGNVVTFENNKVVVMTPEEFQLFLLQNFRSVEFMKYTRSGNEKIKWAWLQETLQIPKRVERHLMDKPSTPSPHRIIHGRNFPDYCGGRSHHNFLKIVERTLQIAVNRDIEFAIPHNNPTTYKKDGPFQINIWSTAEQLTYNEVPTPARIWDIPVSCRDGALVPKQDKLTFGIFSSLIRGKEADNVGIPIKSGDYRVATLYKNALFIHHDVTHHGDEDEKEIFAMILRDACKLIMEPGKVAEYQKELEKREEAMRREKLRRIAEASVKKKLKGNVENIKRARKVAAEKSKEYFEAERHVFKLEQGNNGPEIAAKFMAEYDKINSGSIPGILGTEVTLNEREELVILYDDILMPDPIKKEDVYHLGKFKVVINMKNGNINIVNLTYGIQKAGTSRKFHHPHIFYDGDFVCLGNIETELKTYIAHYELEAAAGLILAFLQSVNPDHESQGYMFRMRQFPRHTPERKVA